MTDAAYSKADLQALIDGSPFTASLGFVVSDVNPEAGQVTVIANPVPNAQRMENTDQFHGGVLAALIDLAGDLAVAQALGGPVPTIDLKVDYLRPAAGEIRAVATARKIGRTVSTADVDVLNRDGKLCALGRAIYASKIG